MQRLAALIRIAKRHNVLLQAIAAAHGFIKQCLQTHLACCLHDIGKSVCQFRIAAAMCGLKQGAARFANKGRLHEIVHHLEVACDVRLKRELMQDRFAECVDGLDFQPAWRFKRPRKKPACHGKPCRSRTPAFKLDKPVGQILIRQHCPFRQSRKNTVLHDGRCRLGIGEAENFRRVGAFEQQPDNALSQNVSLAGTGIGRHPDRGQRIGGTGLRCNCFRWNHTLLFHSPPSPPASPPADHSSTRAR
ncbi:hypothetical protein D3C80_278640 [compost metagenome]